MLFCNQHYTLHRLLEDINIKVGIIGRLLEAKRGYIYDATHEISDKEYYAVALDDTRGFMEDMNSFVAS